MRTVRDYLAAIKQAKGIVDAVLRILPLLSMASGPGNAKWNIIPIDTPLRAPAGVIAFILSVFAFLFVFAKDYERLRVGQLTRPRRVTAALGYMGGGILCFFIYWTLRSYFGRNPPFITQGFTEAMMIILYAFIFAFWTKGFTLAALKLYLDRERILEAGKRDK